ncbi:hypothetical protein BY996DRAFT_6585160 [Phakopsora pachyrhizi]|uniref:Uncharacterized protein n=1 Tax=Phakopsora pachyrhizi TaxID=170000 RepID=A0AAV0B8Y5_PHAPC|nr:hypothetical protein BY996DRAFT_6585160 [Phakopsora pachyrhizi]CAH7682558.1 hypothetical protein PPACK8108_LOCUS15523 [Phakopsora pachyrhizi]
MISSKDRYRQHWALDEEAPEEIRSEPYSAPDQERIYFSRGSGRTRYESSTETYLGSRIIGSPPSEIPRYTGNYNQHHKTNSFSNQSAKYSSVNNNKSKPTYQRQLDDATPEDIRFKTTGSRGSQNQTNQAHNNFYQKSTRPTNDYWPETSQGFGTYERPSSVDQQYSGQYTYHKNTNHFIKYTMEDLEALSAWTKEQGGINDQQDYNDFVEDFNIILKYLIEDGQIIDEDEAGDLLLNSLSTQLRKFLLKKEIKFMRMMDSGCAKKNPKVEQSSRPWDIIRTFGIKASKITSSNKTENIIDATTENFNNIPQPKAQQHKKPEEKESPLATSIGPMVCKTTPLINNAYVDINQGIQNQSEDIKKEEETNTNLASPLDKVEISAKLLQSGEENIFHQKESKESIQTASIDYYPTCKIPENYDQENQLIFGNSQQLEEEIYQEQHQELQLPTKSLSEDSINQAENKEEETIYLVGEIESVMKDLHGYSLMDEDFGLILRSITSAKFLYDLWIERREKVFANEIGQWIYFDGWEPGAGTQPGLSDSSLGNMDQSWEPIKEQVKLGSSVQTLEDFINEENLEEKEESQLPIKLSPTPVKEITELSCTIDTGKRDNVCPIKFRIWNQEPKALDPGEEEKENQLHKKAQHSGNNSHQRVDHKIQQEYSQKEKKMLETNNRMNKNQEEAKIKEVGEGALQKQNQTTKKVIKEEIVMKTPGGLNQQQKHFSIMTIYKSVLNKFKPVKQQIPQECHPPLIEAPHLRNHFIEPLTPNPPEPPDLEGNQESIFNQQD